MSVSECLIELKSLLPNHVQLIAVSKTKPSELIQETYKTGQRHFGENKVQELVKKYEELPKDIQWHMIGHLQTNKVKYIVPFVHLVHAVDSFKLAKEINKQGEKYNRVVNILIQVHIAKEKSKFGINPSELIDFLGQEEFQSMKYVRVNGLMGMATFTGNKTQIKEEFQLLKSLFDSLKEHSNYQHINTLSMGMSEDYELAITCGSNMIRVGSAIFGART